MELTRLEQKTVINTNVAEKAAEIYSADPVMIRRMDKLCEKRPDIFTCVREFKDGAKEYRRPKKCVRVSVPKVVSDKQREAARERFAKMREEKQNKGLGGSDGV